MTNPTPDFSPEAIAEGSENIPPDECDCPQGVCAAWVDRAICREERLDEETRKHLRAAEIDLVDLLANFMPGSHDEAWTWDDEEKDILCRVCICCGEIGHYMAQLEGHLRAHGLTEGVCLEFDAHRVLDGHHRIVAARRLGITRIPLESPQQATERWVRDEGRVDWAQRKHGDRAPWEMELRRKGLHYV